MRGDEIMYDVYLGGISVPEWRNEFKSQISSDISVFDPFIQTTEFKKLKKHDKTEQVAREFYFMDQCNIIIFYIDNTTLAKSVRLQIGDAIGRNKQVVVCLAGKVIGKKYMQQYCEYRGVTVVNSIEELVSTVEEYVAQLELCNQDEQ